MARATHRTRPFSSISKWSPPHHQIYPRKCADFLDLTIYKDPRYRTSGILHIKPFFKKTNKFHYLEFNSAHPRNILSSLVKGKLKRLLRVSSNEDTYRQVTGKKYSDHLNKEATPITSYKSPYNKSLYMNRPNLLQIEVPGCQASNPLTHLIIWLSHYLSHIPI